MSADDRPTTGSGWLDDVAIGALSPGVNSSTYRLLNVCFVLLLLPELVMLRYAIHKGEAVGHVCVLILLSIGVFAAINWCAEGGLPEQLISQIGLVSAEEQRASLGLGGKKEAASSAGGAAQSPQATETTEGEKKDN